VDPVIQNAIDIIKAGVVVERLHDSGKGPRAAMVTLAANLQHDGKEAKAWAEHARTEALCGSSQRSLREAGSALRLWGAFATTFLGLRGAALLPPPLDGVLAWSRMLANRRTFSNYLGKLVLVCELLRMPTESLKHASVTRAGRTIKAIATAPLPKRYTRRIVVASLIQTAMAEDDHAAAWLYCFSYAFLLRVPSEALPAVMGDNGDAHGAVLPCGRHSSLVRVGSVVKL